MAEVEAAVIAGVGEAEAADQAGDARQVGAEAEGGQDHGRPEEGGGAVASWAEGLDGTPPGEPEEPGAFGGRSGRGRR